MRCLCSFQIMVPHFLQATEIIFSSYKHIWVFIIGTVCLVPDTYYYAFLIFTFLYFQTNSKFLGGIALV